ncbi:HepT-like ribonuclease domain-containing protein [Candidatus Foliamicus sp.]
MQSDPRVLLTDIEQAGADIESFTQGMNSAEYTVDMRTQAAVERKFEVIGEAINRLQRLHPKLAERIPEVRKIVDFRNVLAHGYDHVVPELVWDYTQNHLPQLRQVVNALLDELALPAPDA